MRQMLKDYDNNCLSIEVYSFLKTVNAKAGGTVSFYEEYTALEDGEVVRVKWVKDGKYANTVAEVGNRSEFMYPVRLDFNIYKNKAGEYKLSGIRVNKKSYGYRELVVDISRLDGMAVGSTDYTVDDLRFSRNMVNNRKDYVEKKPAANIKVTLEEFNNIRF